MRKPKNTVRKIRNIRNGEEFYTSSEWPTKEIDGVSFISVKKTRDAAQMHLIKKEGMEYVK